MLKSKLLLVGILLLLLAAAGLAYNVRRPAPQVVTFAPESLAEPTPISSPTEEIIPPPINSPLSISRTYTVPTTARYYAPPQISLTQPLMAAKFPSGSSIPLAATVTRGDSTLLRVDFYAMPAVSQDAINLPWSGVEIADGPLEPWRGLAKEVGTTSQFPYSITWPDPANGQYVIFAVAVDDILIQVASEPVVIIIGPDAVRGAEGKFNPSHNTESTGLIKLPKGAGQGKNLLPFFPRYRRCPDLTQEIRFAATVRPNLFKALKILSPNQSYRVLARRPNYELWSEDPSAEIARYNLQPKIPDSPSHAVNVCPVNPKDPWNTPLQAELETAVDGIVGNPIRTTYYTTGGEIREDGNTSVWNLRNLPAGTYSVVALADDGCGNYATPVEQVRVLNYCQSKCLRFSCPKQEPNGSEKSVVFRITTEEWAIKDKPVYDWQVSAGKILRGQGTDSIEVDTTGLNLYSDLTAQVKVSGLYESCENTASLQIQLGRDCYEVWQQVAAPAVFDQTNPIIAGRKNINLPSTTVTVVERNGAGAQPTPSPTNTNTDAKETEHIQVTWPEQMEIEQQERIKLSFNRTTGQVTASSSSGSAVEIINAKGKTLIKDRFGPEYEAFARAVLGATRLQCDMCGKENFQSLDNETVQWVWSISPTVAGKHTTTVRLDVEWRHRQNQSKKEATIWTKDLPMTITERTFSKKTVILSSGLFGFVGTGFIGGSLLRRKKGQTIIVAGDLVTGTKGDSYNISGGQIGAVGPNAQVHDVKFNDTKKET